MKDERYIFVDDACWNSIEAALAPETRIDLSQKPVARLYASGAVTGVPLAGKGWPTLILKGLHDEPVYFVRGGEAAEKEFYEESRA